ncbi:hypothetical protein HQ865_16865 [Mucilaginibacter mali]|uniref:Uncharacterized protein n=1 Tax=Mucilaginibacter mali TaxID=2740462 RepID=A0A7D4UL19_9SPHI|nr:hypothetical protein [Mucilaginibacter mali]QKJ31362.1 hypothetical protein HQ865_16865 [Mucilaginibacter mali]
MKRIILVMLCIFCCAQLFAGTPSDSTWYRNRQGKELRYVMLPENWKSDSLNIHEVTLRRALYQKPERIGLEIEIYNFLYQRYLVVFSVMPSRKNLAPVWNRINPDTIKDKIIDADALKRLTINRTGRYPAKGATMENNLKYWNYALLVKKSDGWYCSSTDCFTEFFEIISDPSTQKNKSFQINLAAQQLSIAEYESAYKRKHGYYSTNSKSLMGGNEDVANGDLLYNSYIKTTNGQKRYQFWLLSEWVHDGASAKRGMDRFVFVPGIGVVSASYDFFMPEIVDGWYQLYNKKFNRPVMEDYVTYDGYNPEMELANYLTEYTIPEKVIPKPKK